MIHVERKPEPVNFDAEVRKPGAIFLSRIPAPKGKEWKNHEYWRKILRTLHTEYNGICAYSCHWICHDTGFPTVEHFKPKNDYPADAYEWTNYRLACGTLNGRKGKYENVLDPFDIKDGWFTINFPSLLVKPADELSDECSNKVQATIDHLMLNDESTCLKSRQSWIMEYCYSEIPFEYLEKKAPFLALELRRQNLVNLIQTMMIPK